MTRAIGYVRQSLGKAGENSSDSLSLEAQEDAIRRHCIDGGVTLIDTVRDYDISGADWNRPGIAALLAKASAGEIDAVIVYKLSRFSRDAFYQELTHRELKARGVALMSVTEPGVERTLMRLVMGAVNQHQNEELSEWVSASIRSQAHRGLHHGEPPHGYTIEHIGPRKRRMVIVPDEAAVVRRIYDLRVQGYSARKIANLFNAEGVPGPRRGDGHWHDETIRAALKNPAYAGYARFRGEIVGDLDPEHMPPLIDRALWQQVQRGFTAGRTPRKKERSSWLEGHARHGCGKKMWLMYQANHDRALFTCGNAKKGHKDMCGIYPQRMKPEALETAVRMCLAADFAARATTATGALASFAATVGKPAAVRERERLYGERSKLVTAMKRAEDLVLADIRDVAWMHGKHQEQLARIGQIDAELALLSDVPTEPEIAPILAKIDDIATLLAFATDAAYRDVLAAVGEARLDATGVRIVYHPEYRYVFPTPTVIRPAFNPGRGRRKWEYHQVELDTP